MDADRGWLVLTASILVLKFLFGLRPMGELPSPTLKAMTGLIDLAMAIGLIGFGVRVLRSQASGRGKWIFVLVIGIVAAFGLLVIRLNDGPRVELPPRLAQSPPPPDVAKDVQELVESTKPLRDSLREIDSVTARVYYDNALTKLAQGDAIGAQADLDRAIKLNPSDADAYYSRAYAKEKTGDSDGAIADVEGAIKLNPVSPSAYHLRGDIEFKKKQYAAAIEDEEKAIELDPKNGTYYLTLGWYQLFNRKPRESIAASLKALKLSPNDAVAINGNLAHGYLFDNQFGKAKAIYLENKKARVRDGPTFIQSVLDDYKEFKEAGITHPDMEKIKALLTTKRE